MNDKARKEALREELRKCNHGKNIVIAKYAPKYPDSVEREYIRLVNAYMGIERQILLAHIPEIKRIIAEGTVGYHMDSSEKNDHKRKRTRFETIDNTMFRLKILFDTIRGELDVAFGLFHLKGALNKIAALEQKLSIREWKKVIFKTLGIDLLEDYYSGDFYKAALERWVSDNVDLIKTVPANSLDKMKDIVYSSYMEGKPTTDIVKEIQRQYGMDKRHARLIARDQTAKLNAAITKHQQKDAGVDSYEWSDSGDRRVRNSHHRLNGHIFSWDDPPETDGGRHCHPGEDYQCRCCALAVFDIDNLDIPAR